MAKRGTLEHPKTKRLARALDIMPCHALGIVEALRHMAYRLAPTGLIGKFSDDDIAAEIGWEGKPAELIAALVETHWLDQTDDGVAIHDWWEHSDDSLHMTLARKGERFWDGQVPRMSRMRKDERDRCMDLYSENGHAHGMRTPSALNAHAMRTEQSILNCAHGMRMESALPSHPIPSHPIKRNSPNTRGRSAPQTAPGPEDRKRSFSGSGSEGPPIAAAFDEEYGFLPYDRVRELAFQGDDRALAELGRRQNP